MPQAGESQHVGPQLLFIGRDGKVKATHAGFAAPSSGVFNKLLRDEFTSNIERLLKENVAATSAVSSVQRMARLKVVSICRERVFYRLFTVSRRLRKRRGAG